MVLAVSSNILKGIRKLGVDKSIAYSSGARVVQALTGVVSIFFIAQFLTGTEQGFYYTFGSILAIQVFFELGLTNIITQFVSHEVAHLTWKSSTELEGTESHHSRLAHLLRFSVRWYSIIGIFYFLVLVITGLWFFSDYSTVKEEETVIWLIPWILVSLGSAINLFLSPLLAIIMGLDRVKEVMKMRFYQQLILPIATWIGLCIGFRLYVLGIASLLSCLYVIIYAFKTDLKTILTNLWRKKINDKVSYKKEIFPYQWKIALSWVSGYFVFQLFNPVLFASDGAVVAGQMGMSLTVFNAIGAFSQSWINTKVPLFSKLISQNQYKELDRIFRTTMLQVIIVFSFLVCSLFIFIYMLKLFDIKLGYRFLPWLPLILIAIPLLISQFVNGMATYLRCHLKEPMLIYSIVAGILSCASTFILGTKYGAIGMTGGYCIIIFCMSFWAYAIFRKYKKQWHNEN